MLAAGEADSGRMRLAELEGALDAVFAGIHKLLQAGEAEGDAS